MSAGARARRLTWREFAILAEAMAALGVAAFMVSAVSFRRIAGFASSGTVSGHDMTPLATVARVRWAVRAAARRAPWRAKCFEQGLAALWMLRRRGSPATLYYGLARAPEAGLKAHVWVRAGELGVVGCENAGDFAELARFP